MKTREEPKAHKEEIETNNKKLHDLTEDELEQIVGGIATGEHTDFDNHHNLIIEQSDSDFG